MVGFSSNGTLMLQILRAIRLLRSQLGRLRLFKRSLKIANSVALHFLNAHQILAKVH